MRARRLGVGGKSKREHVAGPKTTMGQSRAVFFESVSWAQWKVMSARGEGGSELEVKRKACSDCRRDRARSTLDGSVGGKKYKTIDYGKG